MPTTCPACGHVWGGKRPEQKIDRKTALQRYDKLRDVQVDILWFLFRFTVASLGQIGNVFFDAADHGKRNELAGKHLAVLRSAGFVEAHEPKARQHFKKFFSLAPAGVFVCATEEKMDSRKIKRVKESKAATLLSSIHIGHHLAIVDVMGSLVKAERKGQGELDGYWADREMNLIFSAGGSRRRLQPDSTFLWSAGGRGYLAWLELENSRASVMDLEEKVKKYLQFENAGYHRGDTYRRALAVDRFPPLLIVAAKKSQLPGLRRAIVHGVLEAHVGTVQDIAGRVVIGLATLDDLREHGVLGPCWEPVLQACGPVRFEELFDLRCPPPEPPSSHIVAPFSGI